ncbi:glucosamine-6-phosphate deaminase [Halobacillus faecis]
MNVVVASTYQELSKIAGAYIEEQVVNQPTCVLGLATGSTPIGTYQYLINEYKKKSMDYSLISTLNLDEYVGLSNNHSQSYHSFMKKEFFNHVNIDLSNTHIPNGTAENLEDECQRYDHIIDEIGPPDLQVLGIGQNGHIGFNEPGSSFDGKTHVVKLNESTRKANARMFSSMEEVPTKAITMGIDSIMTSKHILLLASGEQKAEAVHRLLHGPIDEQFPASILQKHSNVTVVVDELAFQKSLVGHVNIKYLTYEVRLLSKISSLIKA